jgi:hypothetical protein
VENLKKCRKVSKKMEKGVKNRKEKYLGVNENVGALGTHASPLQCFLLISPLLNICREILGKVRKNKKI